MYTSVIRCHIMQLASVLLAGRVYAAVSCRTIHAPLVAACTLYSTVDMQLPAVEQCRLHCKCQKAACSCQILLTTVVQLLIFQLFVHNFQLSNYSSSRCQITHLPAVRLRNFQLFDYASSSFPIMRLL